MATRIRYIDKDKKVHIDNIRFEQFGISPPREGSSELISVWEDGKAHSPDGTMYKNLIYGFHCMRLPEFIQRLIKLAETSGVKIVYSRDVLKELVQWKMMGKGNYVMGVEPANCRGSGRGGEREAGRLPILAPGKEVSTSITIEVLPEI